MSRSALQRAESQVVKESLAVSSVIVLGLVAIVHNALASINNHIPYQALLGRQPHLLPPLEGGYFGGLDVRRQNNLAGVREVAAVAIIEATARQRLELGDFHTQIVAQELAEHQAADLVDIWHDRLTRTLQDGKGPLRLRA